MIDELTLDKAMNFLAETDSECAELKANVARSEHMAKVAEAMAYLTVPNSERKNVEHRKAEAKTSDEVKDRWADHFDAVKAYEVVRARRERAVLTVDVYRTQAANRRAGA